MLEILTEEEFNNFALKHPQSTFFQTTNWAEYKRMSGWKYYLLGLKVDNKLICASLIIGKKTKGLGRYLYYAPRGFLIDYKNYHYLEKYISELKLFLRKNKGIYLKINPYYENQTIDIMGRGSEINNKDVIDKLEHLEFVHSGYTKKINESMEPRYISYIDLENISEDEILSNMSDNAKLRINNSYKHGLKLIEIDKDRLNDFKSIMDHDEVRSIDYYNNLYDTFVAKGKAKFILVEIDLQDYFINLSNQKQELLLKIAEQKSNIQSITAQDTILELTNQVELVQNRIDNINKFREEKGNKIITSAGIYMLNGNELMAFHTAYNTEYAIFNSAYFMHFKMIKFALANNYKTYSFYGLDGIFNETNIKYVFVRDFNAVVKELIGEFTLTVSKFNYFLYKTTYKLFYRR